MTRRPLPLEPAPRPAAARRGRALERARRARRTSRRARARRTPAAAASSARRGRARAPAGRAPRGRGPSSSRRRPRGRPRHRHRRRAGRPRTTGRRASPRRGGPRSCARRRAPAPSGHDPGRSPAVALAATTSTPSGVTTLSSALPGPSRRRQHDRSAVDARQTSPARWARRPAVTRAWSRPDGEAPSTTTVQAAVARTPREVRSAAPSQAVQVVPCSRRRPGQVATAGQAVGDLRSAAPRREGGRPGRRPPATPASRRGSRPRRGSAGAHRGRAPAARRPGPPRSGAPRAGRAGPGRPAAWPRSRARPARAGRRRSPTAGCARLARRAAALPAAPAHSSPLSAVAECMTRPCPAPNGSFGDGDAKKPTARFSWWRPIGPLQGEQVLDRLPEPLPRRLVVHEGLRRVVAVEQVDAHHQPRLSRERPVGQPLAPPPRALQRLDAQGAVVGADPALDVDARAARARPADAADDGAQWQVLGEVVAQQHISRWSVGTVASPCLITPPELVSERSHGRRARGAGTARRRWPSPPPRQPRELAAIGLQGGPLAVQVRRR